MMNVFLDSQIWLSIYDFSDDNLEQFSKLKDLLGKDINLYLPQQVKDEVFRNRENKIKEALNKFKDINIQTPNLCKGYDEYRTFQKLLKDFRLSHKNLLKIIENDINTNNLHSDKLISKIFKKSKNIPRTDDIVKKAVLRYDIGNPPGKDKSYGDAINWELLLQEVPNGEDLFFISSDKDYKSVIDENRFNQYLFDEWTNTKNSNIFYCKSLTEYFEQHLKHIELKTEGQKNKLIEQLVQCDSFKKTRDVIAELSRFSAYSDKQIIQLLQVADENSQVSRIIKDSDIKSFYDTILKNNIDNYSDKPEFSWILGKLGYKNKK